MTHNNSASFTVCGMNDYCLTLFGFDYRVDVKNKTTTIPGFQLTLDF